MKVIHRLGSNVLFQYQYGHASESIDNDDENAGDDEILPIPTFSIGAFHKLVESYWVNGLHADLSKYTDPSQLIESYAVSEENDKSKTVLPKFLTVSEIVGRSKP